MPRDTSLDEFGVDDEETGGSPGGSPEERAPSSGDGETSEDDGVTAADTDSPADAVEAAAPTHGWTPGGAPCAQCGETVERRWRADDGEGMVCDDCKEW